MDRRHSCQRVPGHRRARGVRRTLDQIDEADFSRPGVVYQIGVAPGRIDILTQLTGLTFEEAWPGRVRHPLGDVQADFIGREAFVRNKRATGRAKDLGDIDGME